MLENKQTPIEPLAVSQEIGTPAEPECPDGKDGSAEDPVRRENAAIIPTVTDPKSKPEESKNPSSAATSAQEVADTVDREPVPVADESAVSAGLEPPIQKAVNAVYEHPLPVRICHWLNTVSLVVMALSGLQIFMAFPSFGPKIPQNNLIHKLPSWLTLGGWLGGALPWHFTFAWIYVTTGIMYVGYQVLSGNFRQLLFVPRDIPGVWPMARHYFLFGPKPVPKEAYNPLQKIAYTSAVCIGAFSFMTGMVLFNPVQFSFLTRLMGGFHRARIWHFSIRATAIRFRNLFNRRSRAPTISPHGSPPCPTALAERSRSGAATHRRKRSPCPLR